MDSIAEQAVCTAAAGEMPKFADGSINLQELFRQLAESVINAVMDAEAEEMCSASSCQTGRAITPTLPTLPRKQEE
jgi:putative transposase